MDIGHWSVFKRFNNEREFIVTQYFEADSICDGSGGNEAVKSIKWEVAFNNGGVNLSFQLV